MKKITKSKQNYLRNYKTKQRKQNLTKTYKIKQRKKHLAKTYKKHKFYLKKGGGQNTAFFTACREGNEDTVRKMLASNIYFPDMLEDDGEYKGWTPLHAAASNGHMEIVKMLLEASASTFSQTPLRKTADELAEENGHTDVAEYINFWEREHNPTMSPKEE